MVRFVLALLILAAAGPAGSAWGGERGRVRVFDGDTLVVAGAPVRLYGIDAPETGQVCARHGTPGAPWACGAAAARLLRRLVRAGDVRCRGAGRDPEGRPVARCHVGWIDLGAEMIARGMAVPYPQAARDYLRNHREARALGEGMFAGEFVAPQRWRRGERHPIESAN